MKRIILSLAILATAIGVNAQLLWKVTGNGLSKPSYLFGTHHVAPASILDNTSGFNDALNSVDAVYGEMVMGDMAKPETQQLMMSTMMAPADSTLSRLLSTEQLTALQNIIDQYAGAGVMSIANFEALRPAALTSTLAVLISAKAFSDFNPAMQLDGLVQQRPAALGKEVKGFETPAFQIGVLYGSPISRQIKDLLKVIDNDSKAIETTRKLADAYMSGDLNALYSIMTDPDTGMDTEEADTLINRRNSSWVDLLMGILPTTSVLIVVGAGHLPGDTGVISLLRKAGFSVTPV